MACCYQSILDLEKCNHYIEGVILNLEASLKEDKIINRKTNNGKKIVFYYMLSITLFEFLINCCFHTSNESFLLIYIADY